MLMGMVEVEIKVGFCDFTFILMAGFVVEEIVLACEKSFESTSEKFYGVLNFYTKKIVSGTSTRFKNFNTKQATSKKLQFMSQTSISGIKTPAIFFQKVKQNIIF